MGHHVAASKPHLILHTDMDSNDAGHDEIFVEDGIIEHVIAVDFKTL